MNINLYAPKSYRQADKYTIEEICNGCGSKGLGGWLVPDTLYGLSIHEACQIHDWCYHEGTSIADKESADRIFLNNMVRIIDSAEGWVNKVLRPLRRIRAKDYYMIVRNFGGPAFWDGKNE